MADPPEVTIGELYDSTKARITALTEPESAWPPGAGDAMTAGSPRAADNLASLAASLKADTYFDDARTAPYPRFWSQTVAIQLLDYLLKRMLMCGLYDHHPLIND